MLLVAEKGEGWEALKTLCLLVSIRSIFLLAASPQSINTIFFSYDSDYELLLKMKNEKNFS